MKNKNISKFISSLIYILMGLALILKPELVKDAFCYILAAAAILMGIVKLVAYLATKVETRIAEDTNGFALGISLILLGLFVLMKSTMFVILIPFVLGFMITFKGIEGIQNVLNLKKFGFGYQKKVMVVSVIILWYCGYGKSVLNSENSSCYAWHRSSGQRHFRLDCRCGIYQNT